MRKNMIRKIKSGEELFPGIIGFEGSVIPQIENAILSGQDIVFLGERGQAKSRLIRSLASLLDAEVPVIDGCEINDNPYAPICRACRDRVAAQGDRVTVRWITPDERYSEKLATPDTSIADLIGEVDPIRVAEGKYLADELTIHYGLVPRTNRGIFAINELPDLAERIQVGLLNVLEERDVQIRGYKVRLPLDVMLVASANPEDYTNRGRIITPLKDRFGAQIRTHYPTGLDTEMAVVAQEARPLDAPGVQVTVPAYMAEVVAAITHQARRSSQVNQRSGVSVRLSIANHETMVANALRRALRLGEPEAVPRVSDLPALAASTGGKVEIESLEEGREGEIVDRLVKAAVLETWRAWCRPERFRDLVAAFDGGLEVDTGDDVPSSAYAGFADLPGIKETLGDLEVGEAPAEVASAVEFVLEGLHLSKRLNKDAHAGRATYRARA